MKWIPDWKTYRNRWTCIWKPSGKYSQDFILYLMMICSRYSANRKIRQPCSHTSKSSSTISSHWKWPNRRLAAKLMRRACSRPKAKKSHSRTHWAWKDRLRWLDWNRVWRTQGHKRTFSFFLFFFIKAWLCDIERIMRSTLKDKLRDCRGALKKSLNKRDKWIKDWPGQVRIKLFQFIGS